MSVCLRTCCKGCCDSSAGFPPSLQPMSPHSPCARTAAELGFVLCLGRTPWGERSCLRDSRIDLYCTDRSRIVKQSLDVIAMKPEIKIEVVGARRGRIQHNGRRRDFGLMALCEFSHVEEMHMLEMRPNCECCDRNLPADQEDAFICSFECTYCRDCAERILEMVCPNCGGQLVPRPCRPQAQLTKHPGSTKRVSRSVPCRSPRGAVLARSG